MGYWPAIVAPGREGKYPKMASSDDFESISGSENSEEIVNGSESPTFHGGQPPFSVPKVTLEDGATSPGHHELPNEISAPYEVPQFPIEQIEKKLAIQRHISSRTPLTDIRDLLTLECAEN
uniref:Uncharacterized protein n=1 Tax=Timema tahoe TaxID=61484 RepID=A0A7R9IAV6_9NEOP|nr:unnamed protein product [Timema tahoe]